MSELRSVGEIVEDIDQLSELLASTEKMTIYHGFKGGARAPFEQAEAQIARIRESGPTLRNELQLLKEQNEDKDSGVVINLSVGYLSRVLENAELMSDITQKLKRSSDGGKRYGFFAFRKDSKNWDRSTKKLLNIRSNVELLLRTAGA